MQAEAKHGVYVHKKIDHEFRKLIKLISHFSDLSTIYYEFSKFKTISGN